MPIQTDIDLSAKDIGGLSSPDAVAGFFTDLCYPTGCRKELTAGSLGLTGDTAQAVTGIELVAADAEDFFRVVFVKVRSITAKTRNEIARKLGQTNIDHLIVLASNFDYLEFVLVDKRTRQHRGPGGGGTVQVIPRTITVNRKGNTQLDRRILRRLTWTGRDGLDQFAKLRSVFESAAFASQYFQNRALFADHFLQHRLREDPAWRDNPSSAFANTKSCLHDARIRWTGQPEQTTRDQLYGPLWSMLGFKAKANKDGSKDQPQPDYVLKGGDDKPLTVAFTYRWDRWLDGPDIGDPDTPEENPGAAVVSALNDENTRWAIVTNGKLWRLYCRDAHSRSTNFYEVDLEEALIASDETDPNEAFRYWWLFFRAEAFKPISDDRRCWLDTIVQGSRDYAKRLGDRLKDRIFLNIFPHLADGFLADRKQRLGTASSPADAELTDTFQATLTLLYRLLFLLYAESRDLLPIRESPYELASLKRIKGEIAENAGKAESSVADQLAKIYDRTSTKLYDRLSRLFAVMDKGDTMLNVPCYNGGLFITDPKKLDDREHRIARFLVDHKVPDLYLALAIDRLSRDQDEKPIPGAVSPNAKLPYGLVPIDYKSLEVRHLGSIYEGLLEFKLKIAEEDLTTTTEKKKEKYIPLSQAKPGKRKTAVTVRKGEVYLSNDKAERKATGSYYTPDPIVEYIVEHTVGPVLREKLDGLRDEFRDAAKTFHRHTSNAKSNPGLLPTGSDPRTFAGEKTYAEHKDLVDRLFDFKVLDPAMGSGHFLVEAVDFITDALLDFLNRFPNNPVAFALQRTRSSILDALGRQGVSVDADKLTDVNLLKRHVLKRCIYGVDFNPMAVELAKVSLWLDAFTLGAPLSFLDHHLRCGNSLIGATFKDLEKATQGQLFSIDYQPLLDAIRNVLFVNAMADATTAEVHESVRRYGDARKALSGYKIVFDLLVADHFMPSLPSSQGGITGGLKQSRARKEAVVKPSSLLTHAHDLDLSTRESFVKSLGFKSDREMVAAVEELADRPDRRFFHWEIEFPEVFFGFEDADQRRIKHLNEIIPSSAGFDAVVGNPPYVRQESITPLKEYLQTHYATYDGSSDLYVYFQEREVAVLRADGRMGMIVANKWMRAGYGRAVRRFLQRVAQPLQVIDFGHSPIFPDADTFPCIPIVARRQQSLPDTHPIPEEETTTVCSVPREHWNEGMNLSEYVRPRVSNIPTRLLRDEGWSLERPAIHRLMQRLLLGNPSLRDFVGEKQYFGVKSGCNDAFYISSEQRDALIATNPASAEVIKPLLRGRDIDRWQPRSYPQYLLFMRRGIEIAKYPAIKDYLSTFRERLEPRPDSWSSTSASWHGRKPGTYRWYELQDAVDYYTVFEQPKLVFQRIGFHSRISMDVSGSYPNDSTTCLPVSDRYVCALLNSSLLWWFMWRYLAHMKDEALFMNGTKLDEVPIAAPTCDIRSRVETEVDVLMAVKRKQFDVEEELVDRTCSKTGALMKSGIVIGDLAEALGVLALRTQTDGPFTLPQRLVQEHFHPAELFAMRADFLWAKDELRDLFQRQLDVERKLASLVEVAYGLTDDEIALLRETRPIRDPLDVLEAKIAGRSTIDAESDQTEGEIE